MLLAQELIARLDINFAAYRLVIDDDDHGIIRPPLPIPVSERSLCGTDPEYPTSATSGANPQRRRDWPDVDARSDKAPRSRLPRRSGNQSRSTAAAPQAPMASMIFAVNRGGSRPAMYPGCFIRGLMSNPGQVNRLNSETTIALPGTSPAVRAISSGMGMAF